MFTRNYRPFEAPRCGKSDALDPLPYATDRRETPYLPRQRSRSLFRATLVVVGATALLCAIAAHAEDAIILQQVIPPPSEVGLNGSYNCAYSVAANMTLCRIGQQAAPVCAPSPQEAVDASPVKNDPQLTAHQMCEAEYSRTRFASLAPEGKRRLIDACAKAEIKRR